MKAIVCTSYGPPEVLQLREVEKPNPKNNEVCIKIFATAVTSSDCIIRGFKVPMEYWLPMRLYVGFRKPRKLLGIVFAGEVDSVGKDVKSFTKGDQVFGWDIFSFGAYAEYKCIPEKGMLVKKPNNVNYVEAAAVTYGGLLALYYLKKGNIQRRLGETDNCSSSMYPKEKVLIYGASGSVGSSAVQIAKSFGAEVTGVCSTINLGWVKSLGADTVIDYTKEDFTKRGVLYDFIFDAVPAAHRTVKLKYEKALSPNGKYSSVTDGSPKLHIEDLNQLKDLIEAGKIKPVIDQCLKLEQIVEAHRYVDQGHKKGNVVITVGDN